MVRAGVDPGTAAVRRAAKDGPALIKYPPDHG